MPEATTTAPAGEPSGPALARASEWRSRLLALTLAWLLVETVSGLAIWLLPFSVPAQWTVIIHTLVGILGLVPLLVYLVRHIAVYWERPGTAVKWLGYLGGAATAAALVSGLVL